MSPVERFTRDGASKYVWGALALVAAIGLVYAIIFGGRAVADERAASQDRAVRYVDRVIDPRLDGLDLAAPITGQFALEIAVRGSILSDPRVSRVRIWSADGRLLFSTDESDRLGSKAGLNDPVLRDAARHGPLTLSGFSDSGGANDPERSLLRNYVPFRGTIVAEIDETDASTVGVVRTEWFSYEILAAGLLLLFLFVSGLSLREPIEPINTGVRFADSSIPAGFSLIDDDRLHAVQEVYRLASERVVRLQEKLEVSERARRKLEGEIQQVLSKAGAGAPRPAAAAAPPPAATPPAPAQVPTPASERTVVQVPESEVVVTSPRGGAWAAAPAGPLARAARDQKTVPVTSLKKKPAGMKPKRASKGSNRKPERKVELPEVATPRPAPAPERREAPTPTPTPTPRPERREAPAVSTPAPELREAPAVSTPTPAPVAARPPATSSPRTGDDAKAHAAALETFIRLTESDRQQHDTTTVDQGAVRAALARTAARKKPGGERLQLPDTHEESPGGPPPAGSE